MKNENEKVAQCVRYFKSKPGFERLMAGLRDKYVSLSHYGGTVRLTNVTQVEKDALEGFFQKPYGKNKSVSISLDHFQKALANTRFSDITIQEIVEGYFGESLESKKEQKAREQMQWNEFLDKIEHRFSDSFSLEWFRKIRKEESGALVYVKQLYQENQGLMYETIVKTMQGADAFPVWKGTWKRLDIFATEITGNPHFFDVGTRAHRLLFYLIDMYVEKYSTSQSVWELGDKQYEVERRMELMFRVGLLSDEISNRTVVYGIHLRKRTGELHMGIEGFCKEMQPITIMLHQMRDVKEAYGDSNIVYVFENPSVFTEFIRKFHEKRMSVVCTNGQLMFTSLLLLDLLVKNGARLFYSGDFDPEGLQIADKLKMRYRERLILWHYDVEDYKKAKSDKTVSKIRMAKLDKILSEELIGVVEMIRKEKVAGYQEKLIEDYGMDE